MKSDICKQENVVGKNATSAESRTQLAVPEGRKLEAPAPDEMIAALISANGDLGERLESFRMALADEFYFARLLKRVAALTEPDQAAFFKACSSDPEMCAAVSDYLQQKSRLLTEKRLLLVGWAAGAMALLVCYVYNTIKTGWRDDYWPGLTIWVGITSVFCLCVGLSVRGCYLAKRQYRQLTLRQRTPDNAADAV